VRNRYVKRSRISEAVFRRFARHVAADLTAVQIAALTGLNHAEYLPERRKMMQWWADYLENRGMK
jgi:D-alanyl-D-alanine dipeptidase